METEQIYETFTGVNIVLLVNDEALGGVTSLLVEDVKSASGNYTRITMEKAFIGSTQRLVELMRTQRFSFKLVNQYPIKPGHANGWIALDAELEQFKIYLNADGDNILRQTLVVKAPTFTYLDDVSPETMAAKEEEDLRNLIEILKKNRPEDKPEGLVKYGVPEAVLPSDDEFDTVTKHAFELWRQGEPLDVKGKDKKKKKKSK